MKFVLLFLLVATVGFGVYRISLIYRSIPSDAQSREHARETATPVVGDEPLPGLSPPLEASLANATQAGPQALRQWLNQNGAWVPEPRLSAIQLDYAQMLVRTNPAEARRIYAAVKARTPANSPLASRLKQLSRTFE
ncbi:MAG: hypothetical protein NTX70_02430 [Verrucomicrobia bacterium]|nr:hypothetical protein [Verrucomicrobiota bacterium]